jgi:hypothetical protein
MLLNEFVKKLEKYVELGYGNYEITNPDDYDILYHRPQYPIESEITVRHCKARPRIHIRFHPYEGDMRQHLPKEMQCTCASCKESVGE